MSGARNRASSSEPSGPASSVRLRAQDVPVSVVVKKPKRLAQYSAPINGERHAADEEGNARVSRRNPHQRSKAAYAKTVPWVPAPAKTMRNTRITWEGDKAMLEIPYRALRDSDAPMDRSDLDCGNSGMPDEGSHRRSTDDRGQGSARYGEASDGCGDTYFETNSHDDKLVASALQGDSTSQRELLSKSERENEELRSAVDSLKTEAHASRKEMRALSGEREHLLRKLVEAEAESRATAEEATRLVATATGRCSPTVGGVARPLSASHHQHDVLALKLSDFEETNRALRRLLDEQRAREDEVTRSGGERRAALAERLGAASEENGRLRAQLLESEKRQLDQRIQLEAARDEQLSLRSVQTSLEQTRAHLQRELRGREADCNRMAVQVRTLESRVAQERVEVEHLQDLLRQAHAKYDHDKDALKKAARFQKQRVTQTAGAVEQLATQLADKEHHLADAILTRDAQRNRSERLATEVSSLNIENAALKKRLSEQEANITAMIAEHKENLDTIATQLHAKDSEILSWRTDSERQATLVSALEKRSESAEELTTSLRSDLCRLEADLSDKGREVVEAQKATLEANTQLEEQRQLVERVRTDADAELDDVRQRLMARLTDLEPLPDTLRTAELRRTTAEERALALEKHGAEAAKVIAQLTDKAEKHGQEALNWRERYQALESNLQARIGQLQGKLSEMEAKSGELSSATARREEALLLANQRLEQTTRDNVAIARQLDVALADARQAHEEARDHALLKEKSLTERVRNLDEQLNTAKGETARVRRERDECERRLNSRLADLKDRLEQSHSTNRSMQNYVQFLKNSYANVFGDVSVAVGAGVVPPMASSSPVTSRSHTSAFP